MAWSGAAILRRHVSWALAAEVEPAVPRATEKHSRQCQQQVQRPQVGWEKQKRRPRLET